jgi:hypothetical protein
LPDATILDLIADLRAQGQSLTGTRLRDELQARHGLRGGVARLYRLLHQATSAAPAPTAAPPPATVVPTDLPSDVIELQHQLAAALERARLAEYREEHHQARWANEVHELRERVRSQRDNAHRLRVLDQDVLDRSRELAAAYLRIAELEARLR